MFRVWNVLISIGLAMAPVAATAAATRKAKIVLEKILIKKIVI